jgi:hypothetical protein
MNVGIVCSCLHAVKPLLKMWLPRFFGSSNDRTPSYPTHKPRSYGITGNRSFPFQSLGGGSDGETRVAVPAAAKRNQFDDASRSRKTPLSDVALRKEYTSADGPRMETWASSGDETVSTPTHGISYTQSVTIDSQLATMSKDVDLERGSRKSQSGGVGPRGLVKDSDSEEWIMNDQVCQERQERR